VQRRIAKLTKKMSEAERQREEALRYAQNVKAEKELLTKRFSSLESSSLKDKEAKIVSALEAAKGKLGLAREAGDLAIEIEAQKEIARLGYEEARLQEMKDFAAKEMLNNPQQFQKYLFQDKKQLLQVQEQKHGALEINGLVLINL
jgi:hypothetical protein